MRYGALPMMPLRQRLAFAYHMKDCWFEISLSESLVNNPPTAKRYTYKPGSSSAENGTYTAVITDPEIALGLANVIALFVHLEERMADILAVLLAASNSEPARYVIRTIRSPKARIDIMRALLTDAPFNISQDAEYDEIIAEFSSINTERNSYVHGIWWSHENGKTILCPFLDELSIMNSRTVTATELDKLANRMRQLSSRIFQRTILNEQKRIALDEKRL